MAIKVQGTTVIDDSRNLQNSVNLNATGNVYANTFIGDGSQITNVPASGGTVTATASGTLADGSTVVLNSDGTVSRVQDGVGAPVAGTPATFEDDYANHDFFDVAYDVNADKVVIVYSDAGNSFYGTAVVGTVSGTSITFGSPVVFNSEVQTVYIKVAYDANAQKVVVVYKSDTYPQRAQARVGTVSGDSISFGSAVAVEPTATQSSYMEIAYDSTSQKVVIVWTDHGNSYYGTARVGTVSGTSISFGNEALFSIDPVSGFNGAQNISIAYDTNAQKVVIAYRDTGDSKGRAVVGTVSGTSISFGTPVDFYNTNPDSTNTIYDSTAQKIVISYVASSRRWAIVGTVSGTSISFGTAVRMADEYTPAFGMGMVYDSANDKTVLIGASGSNIHGKAFVGTVSGTSISFDSGTTFVTNALPNGSPGVGATYHSGEGKVVCVYFNDSNKDGDAVVFNAAPSNLLSTNFLGISNGAYANGATATIQISGALDDAQTGLTPGKTHYVLANGSISTTAGSPSVVAGVALTSTKLLVKG